MRLVRLIILTLLAFAPLHAVRAESGSNLEDQFAAHAKEHGRALQDLYSLRRLNPMEVSDATVDLVMRWLTTQRIDQSPGHPEGTSVLFYAHEADELLE